MSGNRDWSHVLADTQLQQMCANSNTNINTNSVIIKFAIHY